MSQTVPQPLKLTADETAAIQRAAMAARHLAMTIGRPLQPALTPMQAGRPGEPTVMMLVSRELTLTLDHQAKVKFQIGLQAVPTSLADHWFVKTQSFKRYGAGPAVGAEPERDPELPPAPGGLAMDESVAAQLHQQGEALIDAKAALADKDQELEALKAQLAAAQAAKPADAAKPDPKAKP